MGNYSEIADAAKTFACTLYKNQPGALIPTPFSDALHQVWDTFCGDFPPINNPGLPAPAAPPFSGGQCNCIEYRVNYTYFRSAFPTNPFNASALVWGPVQGIEFSYPANRVFRVSIICKGAKPSACGIAGTKVTGTEGGLNVGETITSVKITSVAIEAGGADNCGSLPSNYPPAPPPPVGGYTSSPVAITFNDNTVSSYYFNFNPPVLPPLPAKFLPPIVINYFNANINPEFKIPITFNFNGSINFGDAGSGISFNQDDRDNITTIKSITNNTNSITTSIKNEITNSTNIINNKPRDPNDFNPPITNQPPGEYSQTFLGAVQIVLTQVPKNAKTQSGDGAPDVIYAGWFEWKQAGFKLPRQPIHFLDNIFLAPKGVDGFAYTLYTGFNGKATSIINKEKIT